MRYQTEIIMLLHPVAGSTEARRSGAEGSRMSTSYAPKDVDAGIIRHQLQICIDTMRTAGLLTGWHAVFVLQHRLRRVAADLRP